MISLIIFFFFNDTATTEIYTLSLHDALPIWAVDAGGCCRQRSLSPGDGCVSRALPLSASHGRRFPGLTRDRKSTRLNSSHANISYAVFCLKKKKKKTEQTI